MLTSTYVSNWPALASARLVNVSSTFCSRPPRIVFTSLRVASYRDWTLPATSARLRSAAILAMNFRALLLDITLAMRPRAPDTYSRMRVIASCLAPARNFASLF